MTSQKTEETKSAEAPAKKEAEGTAKAAKDWQEQLKKLAYAAVGAINLSQDDVKGFVKNLVEKGEIAKKDGEKFLKHFTERVQQTVKREGKTVGEKAEAAAETIADRATVALNQEKLAEKIHTSIERVLHTMNIATRKDVEALGKQLDVLDRKVGQIVETMTTAGRGGKQSGPKATGA